MPGAPTNGSTAEPFPLASSAGPPMTAVASNPDLAARFTGDPGNPVLAAHQLVAELAQIYFEKPNDTTPRVVVAMPPAGWSDDPAFVGTLLGALTATRSSRPVTTDRPVRHAAAAATCRSGCR